ncbi:MULTISPECIES: aldo/keto reductase [Rhodopseudomonas]|uniref:Aldo/keto reductase n=1 Tax=Rhodopseudomonas palustris TaxID=1076 RepID=A0A0D7DYA2_RHOPL|nr:MULTISPECIES: aldo/keto reductase [Rhodopseudomonas]KIZ33216.1 aldo/keto reductase [Rhodopseudomonas palustris]MDF3809027.1 aldo/keto reductase [Rhodopseudomonas sp. BAL398]WOK16192.1 aldo/keto reductase [Rhodopseudomonas sp. BAL398]
MDKRPLGNTGPKVSAIGLGCMGMSDAYGPTDRGESIATIHAALDAGINLIDTGDFYAMGKNELLIAEALKGRNRDEVQLSVKFGALRAPDGSFSGFDGRPAAIKNFLAYSLVRLGVDHIDIYRPARLDPNVPIEDTIGALSDLVKAGYIKHIGLSEVGADTIRRAAKVHPIVDLQIEYALITRGIEDEILPACRELGIGITAYGVLARGLIGGHWTKDSAAPNDYRAMNPRFQGANLDANLALVERLRAIADSIGASVAQVAIAWVAAQGDDIVPVIGARRRDRLAEALGALKLKLTPAQLADLTTAIPRDAAAGARYPELQMAFLDSEKRKTA